MPERRAALLELLREIGDLKRVRSAHADGSIAERLFSSAWARLAGGEDTGSVMRRITAATLVATRFADLADVLAPLGLGAPERAVMLGAALAEHAGTLPADVLAALAGDLGAPAPAGEAPAFVAMLARQPRAGVTCPGRPRLLFEPPESHAEHCLAVAVIGVLLAPDHAASAETVFLAGLAHHLHNAAIPDAGFTGEMLLGAHLEPLMRTATDAALVTLDPDLRGRVTAALRILPDADTPEGRAFHAADTLDRVLQIDQHLRAGRTTLAYVLDDMQLVHAGPVKPFQDAVLREFGLS
jgi:5'-deoxynucleotidase YfbR-like HD superfamily hydrolase